MDAARHGRGIALTNHLVAADDLAAGRLIEVGKGDARFQPYTCGEYLFVSRADRWDSSLVRRFREWLVQAVGRELPHLQKRAATG